MKKLFAFALLVMGLSTLACAQQTVNLTIGQGSSTTFVAKDSLGNVINNSNYSMSFVISDPTILSFTCVGTSATCTVNGLKAGTATIQWTFTLKSGTQYTGGPITLPADTFNVAPLSISQGFVTYGSPGAQAN